MKKLLALSFSSLLSAFAVSANGATPDADVSADTPTEVDAPSDTPTAAPDEDGTITRGCRAKCKNWCKTCRGDCYCAQDEAGYCSVTCREVL